MAALVLAAAVAWAGGALLVRRGWLDTPGERSSHRRPTRTGGGVAVAAGVIAGAALAAASQHAPPGVDVVFVLGAAIAMGALGGLDDRFGLDARLKLAVGVLLSLAVASALPHPRALPLAPGLGLPLAEAVSLLGAALWLLTAVNAVNFMDGADGLVPGGLPIAFTALGVASAAGGAAPVAGLCALACAAYLGFLPWNLAGRLFQGDAGSLFGGFLFAALHLAAAGRGAVPLLFGPLVLLPWLTDVLLTLLRRARGRRPLLSAHREHLYQRWLQATGRPHLALAARNAAICTGTAAAAGGMWLAPWDWQGPIFAAATAAAVAGWAAASRRLDALSPEPRVARL